MGRGRGKVEVRRIDNSVSRQVTFSKRRRGLAKKARELAVLCDADVALLIFSDKGTLHHFAAYARYGNMSYDHVKMRSKLEALQKSQRNLMGEQLESLTFREVQQLEHQIDSALRNIRSRKDHILLNSIEELQNKETFLMEQNSILEKEKAALGASSLHTTNTADSSTAVATAALPNLNICPGDDSDEPGRAAAPPPPGAAISLPWWMLQPPPAVSQRQEQEQH
ncbi:hypothetical protein SORBI_3008G103500 [Sorghum bicolor]|uniref:Uncharacterized protein n=1 Tax=Sorghum bicolor TaxID=4558 RepID=A0A1B6PCQ5_SORBI|nr:hypothetical protein SORBI_3008G103500 [Sorghum bicolor]